MEFAKGSVAGLASCNRYNAAFTQDAAKVTITPGVLTQMACAEDVMTQEHAFTVALTQVAGARGAGDGVELVDASGKAVLSLATLADLPLEGTTWTLSGLVSSTAVTSPVADSTVTLTIADGKLSGKACNTFRGDVTASNGSFKAGPLMSTKMACASEALTTQETTVLKTLQAASAYSIKGSDLTISAADGTGLVFTGKQ
jgi:heat shock protein HslJ